MNNSRTSDDIRVYAQALRDSHSATCARIAAGAICLGWQSKPRDFKGFIQGSQFRTMTAAAAHCHEFDAARALLRSEYALLSPQGLDDKPTIASAIVFASFS